jgi:putative membrane protein
MESEVRRLHRWSWLFIAAGTARALIVPIVGAVLASGGVLLSRLDLVSVVLVVPVFVYAFIRQRVYNYRFSENELVVRDGLLTKNVRRISYERIHNVALVRNPIHRLLGAATARIETAAGGKPEAVLRVVTLEAAEELRRYTLGDARRVGSTDPAAAEAEAGPSLQVPDRELLRLGLISNRGFLVVAAVLGAASQVQWWDQEWFTDQDWPAIYESVRANAPGWAGWLFDSGAVVGRVLLGLAALLVLLVLVRVFSMVWYLVRYRGFTLHHKGEDLRADYGLWPTVSSVIPVHRIQLVTVSASFLHRCFKRASIDLETAGATDSDSGVGAASGAASTRQWLAPIVETDRAHGLVREVLPELDIDAVEWKPIEARAARRIVNRIAIVVTPITIVIAVLFTFAPIPLSGWHALWLPAVALTTAALASRQWVRRAGYALTGCAIYFRSGWIGRQVSVVRFVNMQTVSMSQSPFDHRKRMASVSVDTAGAGGLGHRIHIPFLDVDVAQGILRRLYEETRRTEFRW